jgi:hypothetical protein
MLQVCFKEIRKIKCSGYTLFFILKKSISIDKIEKKMSKKKKECQFILTFQAHDPSH